LFHHQHITNFQDKKQKGIHRLSSIKSLLSLQRNKNKLKANNKIKTDFSTGGVIKSASDWENVANNSENWINRSFEERLSAIEVLRQQFIEFFNQSATPDYSVGGKRK